MRGAWLPPLLLAIYGLAFGWKALAGGLLVFDDHPGQLYRLWHALVVGLAPWRLNPGWWAGYAELQFYPPGLSYVGAVLHHASLGMLDVAATYRLLLWVAFLLPGLSTYLFLARVLGNPWLALPGAFLSLTLSGHSRSGVEEGMRWGLVAARLGWGLLPLLALALHRSAERRAPSLDAAALLAAIILIHPAHAPAGVALVVLAVWRSPRAGSARVRHALFVLTTGGGLAAFWLLPLLAHVGMALPLAWGEPALSTLARSMAVRPLLLLLVAANCLGWRAIRRSAESAAGRWLSGWAPVMAGAIIIDALVVQPLGIMWLPADRLLDSFLLALILGASLSLATLHRRWPMLPAPGLALISIALCGFLSPAGGAEPTLSLWPRPWPNEWPKYETVARGVHLPELWQALRDAPAGRILFVRSAVPLEYRSDWRRPHSHLTGLAPLYAGRQILNGTFTHPSPIAGLVYTGSPANRPLRLLVEQRDGLTLFGRPLSELSPAAFNQLADQLLVSAVVALDEDKWHLDFVARNPAFTGPRRLGPFLLWSSHDPRPLPQAAGAQRWRISTSTRTDSWLSTGMAYSPLWRCLAGGRALLTRRSELGLLEVRIPAGEHETIDLEHRPGAAEWSGLALSVFSLVALVIVGQRQRRRFR